MLHDLRRSTCFSVDPWNSHAPHECMYVCFFPTIRHMCAYKLQMRTTKRKWFVSYGYIRTFQFLHYNDFYTSAAFTYKLMIHLRFLTLFDDRQFLQIIYRLRVEIYCIAFVCLGFYLTFFSLVSNKYQVTDQTIKKSSMIYS